MSLKKNLKQVKINFGVVRTKDVDKTKSEVYAKPIMSQSVS